MSVARTPLEPSGEPSARLQRAMVYVADLQRSAAFYTSLGLVVTTRDDEVARLTDCGGTTLVLHERENAGQVASRGCRLYFATRNADALLERLQAAHPEIELIEPVRRMPWGRRHGYLLDPDGWEISIFEPDGEGT
jgi:catechol 2,3-dioxygenase-like lactoylglutathione lyase family enzyme